MTRQSRSQDDSGSVATVYLSADALKADDRRYSFRPALLSLPAHAMIALIRVYQATLSPALPVLTMGQCGCRFSPTCSHYAVEALRTHGALAGMWLALRRLAKCMPRHPGGFDPVPPRCVRVAANSFGSTLPPFPTSS